MTRLEQAREIYEALRRVHGDDAPIVALFLDFAGMRVRVQKPSPKQERCSDEALAPID